ncbi:MAG: hypothetical protein MJZ23_00565 [Paludibacteraceae bacterium]|nr:hypothetical protein [Paludibacteraceae bacterium]
MKKILALLSLFIFAIGFQSCGDDDNDNDNSSIIGIWKESSYHSIGGDDDEDDYTVYYYFTPDYLYSCDNEYGTWNIARYKYHYNNGNIYDEDGDYIPATVSGSTLTLSFFGLATEKCQKQTALPSEIKALIDREQFTTLNCLYD